MQLNALLYGVSVVWTRAGAKLEFLLILQQQQQQTPNQGLLLVCHIAIARFLQCMMWSRIFKSNLFLAAKCLRCFWKWNLGFWQRIFGRFNCLELYLLYHLCQKLLPRNRGTEQEESTVMNSVPLWTWWGQCHALPAHATLSSFVSPWRKTRDLLRCCP